MCTRQKGYYGQEKQQKLHKSPVQSAKGRIDFCLHWFDWGFRIISWCMKKQGIKFFQWPSQTEFFQLGFESFILAEFISIQHIAQWLIVIVNSCIFYKEVDYNTSGIHQHHWMQFYHCHCQMRTAPPIERLWPSN